MNNMHMRTGLFFVSILAGFTQPVLSAALIFEDSKGELPCGQVENLTVTSGLVRAKGNISCLTVSGTKTPTAAPQHLGTVDTSKSTSKDVTKNAIVKLPVVKVTKVTGPKLPGASVSVNGNIATYYAPSSADITASTSDSFTFTITDSTGTSLAATASVDVNRVEGPSVPGCSPSKLLTCMGEISGFPQFTLPLDPNDRFDLGAGNTHVWAFDYNGEPLGEIGVAFGSGSRLIKISKTSGDVGVSSDGCYVNGELVYYEPSTNAQYDDACNLISGESYFLNIKSALSVSDKYQLDGRGI